MTRISKCEAVALATDLETSAHMFEFAHVNNIPEMAQQARRMELSACTLQTTIAISPLLFFLAACYTAPNSMGEHLLVIASGVNTSVSAYALKKLYNTACYLQTALQRYPNLKTYLARAL